MNNPEKILARWNIHSFTVESGKHLQGSPRRSLERSLIKSDRNYILEKISWIKKHRREEQAKTLEMLYKKRLKLEHYILSKDGTYVIEYGGSLWMLKEYIAGQKPPRPDFIYDSWRGHETGKFLVKMRHLSPDIPVEAPYLPKVVDRVMRKLERKMPEIYEKISPTYDSLTSLMESWEKIPQAFSHGDFHPMNIIWGEERINAVIDWEFMGMRPELYDAAMMLGCLGIEDADGLFSPFAEEFISTLKKGDFSERSWGLLPELIIATRFAWLDEWISNGDEDMLDMEGIYIRTLSKNIYNLKNYFINL